MSDGFVHGYSGEEISLICEGVKIAGLQNLSWKESQSKSVIRGAGHRLPHAMGRGPKSYELDFEIKELNNAMIEEEVMAERSGSTQLKTFRVGDQEFTSLMDLRNLTILLIYPEKNGLQKTVRFFGFEFDEHSGSFSVDEESIGRKVSGVAINASGLV